MRAGRAVAGIKSPRRLKLLPYGLIVLLIAAAVVVAALAARGENATAPAAPAMMPGPVDGRVTNPPHGATPAISDEQVRQIREQRYRERLGRVLEVMKREQVDFQAQPLITSDGRISARVMPVDTREQ